MNEQELARVLSFTKSDIWDASIQLIDDFIESELRDSIGPLSEESQRAHMNGRVDGMLSLRDHLIEVQRSSSMDNRIK